MAHATPTRVGLIGAGYIAAWHAQALRATPGAVLSAVCDRSRSAAEGLAHAHGVPAFESVDALIESGCCDAAHILTPPDLHRPLALQCLRGGLDILVEKPVAESAAETREIAEAAEAAGRRFAPGHNFLGLPGYERLKSLTASGDLGRISSAEITWALPLAPLRSGPYGLWLMRQDRNLLLEVGPHLLAFAQDLFGAPEILACLPSHPVALPGGEARPQTFRILGRAGHVDLTFTLTMVETVDDRSVTLRGSAGRVRLDIAADTLVVDRENTGELVLNPLRRQAGLAAGHLREGVRNALLQSRTLNTRSPYAESFRGMTRALYGGTEEDPRFTARAAVAVMQALDDALALLPPPAPAPEAPALVAKNGPPPKALVIGGTGYIGRALTRALVERGQTVRVVSRGAHGPFPHLAHKVEAATVSTLWARWGQAGTTASHRMWRPLSRWGRPRSMPGWTGWSIPAQSPATICPIPERPSTNRPALPRTWPTATFMPGRRRNASGG
jgi:predicted dehydrogenase